MKLERGMFVGLISIIWQRESAKHNFFSLPEKKRMTSFFLPLLTSKLDGIVVPLLLIVDGRRFSE
jgi:hypothetical protein